MFVIAGVKHRIVLIAILFGLAAWLALGADVSGPWTAQVPSRGGELREMTFHFKVDGDKLTGSVVTARGEAPISDGKISGDDISFAQTLSYGGNEVKILYKGKVSGNEIKFTRQREGGEGAAREFVAKRKGA